MDTKANSQDARTAGQHEPDYHWISVLASPRPEHVRGAMLVLMALVGNASPLRLRATKDYSIDEGHILVYSALTGNR